MSCAGGLTINEISLSREIKERAHHMIHSKGEFPVAAAGLQCLPLTNQTKMWPIEFLVISCCFMFINFFAPIAKRWFQVHCGGG